MELVFITLRRSKDHAFPWTHFSWQFPDTNLNKNVTCFWQSFFWECHRSRAETSFSDRRNCWNAAESAGDACKLKLVLEAAADISGCIRTQTQVSLRNTVDVSGNDNFLVYSALNIWKSSPICREEINRHRTWYW